MTKRITQFALAAAMAVTTGAFIADTSVSSAQAVTKKGCKVKNGTTHQCNFTQRRKQTFTTPTRRQNFGAGNDFSRARDSEGGNGGGGGGQRSDIRLKRDIEALGTLANGLTLYRFKYLWSDTDMVGVMAQEVLNVAPEAVITGEDGFYRVNYDKLGISMMTYDEWKALVAELDQLPLAA